MPTTKKTTKAQADAEETRLPVQTSIKSAKTKTIAPGKEHEQTVSKDELSYCSCEKCDSFECFALRNVGQCSCNPLCKGTKYCLRHKKKHTVKQVESKNESIKASESHKSNNIHENKGHKCEKVVIKIEKTKPDSSESIPNSEDQRKFNKRGKITVTKNENQKTILLQNVPNTDSFIKECVKKEITYEYINNNGKTSMKHSKYSYCNSCDSKDKIRGIENIPSTRVTHVHSTSVVYSRKDNDFNTAKLSAQIMNVPYKEFKESISYSRPSIQKTNHPKVSKLDIFKRIKEVYKACSCRVCECIVGKSITARSDVCNCKPCECNECVSCIKNLDSKQKFKHLFIGCPCIRCDRVRECKGLIKRADTPLDFCDCEPCDHCLSVDTTSKPCFKPCDCKPCECIECKSYRAVKPSIKNNVIVGSMLEDIPRSYCQCAPCDCAECGQDFPMSSSLRHEMGTGISRPTNCACDSCMSQSCENSNNNSCSCEIERKLMSKPVEKDNRDYDIHRASVKNTAKAENINKKNTIAMFASLKNNFPRFETINNCSCGDCECIVCSCKENTATSIKASRFLDPIEKSSNIDKPDCQCAACDCQFCANKDDEQCLYKNFCKCDICDCLNCVHLPKPTTSNAKDYASIYNLKNKFVKNACKCDPCECTDCNKLLYKCTGDNCYCTNCKCQMCSDQSRFINETVFRNGNDYFSLPLPVGIKLSELGVSKTLKKGALIIQARTENTTNDTFQNFEAVNKNPEKDVPNLSIDKSSQYKSRKSDSMKHPILTCEAYVQCKDQNVILQYCNGKTTDYKSSTSFMSEHSLFDKKNVKPIEVSSMPPILIHKSLSTHSNNVPTLPESTLNSVLNSKLKKLNLELRDLSTDSAREKAKLLDCDSYLKNEFKVQNQLDKWHKKRTSAESCKDDGKENGISKQDNDDNMPKMFFNQRTNDITFVRDMSVNLVNSLRTANKRLSNLMQPKLFQNSSKIGPSKANISLPSALINMDKTPVNNNTGDFTECDIDYEKLNNTLKQARLFSVELMKVLNEYKRANQRLETISQKHLMLNKTFVEKYLHEKRPIFSATMYETTANERIREKMLSNDDPMKKYGLHNLHIEKNKQDISEGDGHQVDNGLTANVDINNKKIPLHKNDQNSMIVDSNAQNRVVHVTGKNIESYYDSGKKKCRDDASTGIEPDRSSNNKEDEHITYIVTKKGQSLENQAMPCGSNSTLNIKQFERYEMNHNGLEKLRNQSCEYRGKYHLDKWNSKYRRRSSIPRSAVLYKRLKLKEALVNFASNANTTSTATLSSQENTAPTQIKQDEEKVLVPKCSQTKHKYDTECETTSTSMGIVNESDNRCSHQQFQVDMKDTLRAIARVQNAEGRNKCCDEETTANYENSNSLQPERPLYYDVTIQASVELIQSKPLKSKIELELKDFTTASSQTCEMTISTEKAVDCMDDTFSVVLLKRQIRELIENRMNLSQPLIKKSSKKDGIENSERSLTKTSVLSKKSSYDPLKVKFHSLRRVSDHTILVKWNIPEDAERVEGYELLVDGRTVQKIISPSRCMAVVTCLPHVDKVLITIRTIVSSTVQCAHFPTSTIVYKMRAK